MVKSLYKIRLRYSILKFFGYEHLLDKRKKMIVKLLPKNAVIIDCGAHVGGDSIFFARYLPKGFIHSFEPVPSIYQKLVENTKSIKI
ncbi:MAG: FkbM family methyltransferase [Saprospiraceae bacterium]|nr:FkbM family methyltransferase [Saprospiraceae bacterium]